MQDNIEQNKKLTEQEPLVGFAQTCLKSKDNILVRDLAKIACDQGINVGEKRLFKKLREWNMLMSKNTPYQRFVDQGVFVVIESNYETPYGTKLALTTKVTPKGQVYIIEKLRKLNEKGEI